MEKYSKNVRFCLICNYQHKIIPAIQSRCTRFRFSPLNNDEIRKRLNEIIDAEKLTISDDAAKALIQLSKGDMRKVLNVLQVRKKIIFSFV
jgi:replication factor C subunit 3/5